MIKRIVKLTFQKDKTEDFLQIFEDSKNQIAGFKGCLRLELLREKKDGNVFFTYSFWENEEALNNYRYSELFGKVWPKTKALFAEKPEAWTVLSDWDSETIRQK
ncbi:MAG: putative quinol monooxygenase [Saprospiraceae bacterium]